MISRSIVEVYTLTKREDTHSQPMLIAVLPELLEQLVIEAKRFGRISFLDAENGYKRFDFALYPNFTFDFEEVATYLLDYAHDRYDCICRDNVVYY